MQFKKGVILLLLLIAILLPIAIPLTAAEKITIPQEKTKAVVLNEYNPEIPYDPLYLYVGGFDSDKGLKNARILLKFDLGGIQNYVKSAILQINVELTKGFATKLPYEIELHKVTRNWINPGWSEQPSFEPTETALIMLLGNGTYNMDITETVREWLAAGSNFGLLLKGRDETQLNLKQIDTVSLIVVTDDSKPIETAQPGLAKPRDTGLPIDTGLIGDFDRNGCVDFKDFLLFRSAVGTGNEKYNLDGAGLVDNRDYGIFKRHFNEGCFESFDREIQKQRLSKPTGLIGDFDNNGCVDFKDFLLFRGAVGTVNEKYNLDGAGLVDDKDYGIFKNHFNDGCFEKMNEEIKEEQKQKLVPAKKADIEFAIATEKKNYKVGEKIELLGSYERQKFPAKASISEEYIIEFKEEPLINKRKRLTEELERKAENALVKRASINSALVSEKGKIEELHKKIRNDISRASKPVVKGTPTEIIAEYSKVTSGIALRTADEELIGRIGNFDYVESVRKSRNFEPALDVARKIINADYVHENVFDDYKNKLTGKGIKIAIIDTGVDYTHPDLGGCTSEEFRARKCEKAPNGYDFGDNDPDPMDEYGHGTAIAGVAAGTGKSSNGKYKGIAPDAKIYPYKVSHNSIYQAEYAILSSFDAITDIDNDGIPFENEEDFADIASISLGLFDADSNKPMSSDDRLALKVDSLVENGIVAVVAAGNEGDKPGTIRTPGTSRLAITVGSSARTQIPEFERVSKFSSRGPTLEGVVKPDIVAPGEWIYITQLNGGYKRSYGTSISTPLVSGAAALLLQKNPELSPREVKEKLKNNAVDIGADENSQGAGRLDIRKALGIKVVPTEVRLFEIDDRARGSIEIKGIARSDTFLKYTLSYRTGSSPETVFAESTTIPITNSLGKLNLNNLLDAEYEIILKVEERSGNILENSISFQVDNIYVDSVVINGGIIQIFGGTNNKKLAKYEIFVGKIIDKGNAERTERMTRIFEGDKAIENGMIGDADISNLFEGAYKVELKAYDKNSNLLGRGQSFFLLGSSSEIVYPVDSDSFHYNEIISVAGSITNPNYDHYAVDAESIDSRNIAPKVSLREGLPKTFENKEIAEITFDVKEFKEDKANVSLSLKLLSDNGEILEKNSVDFNVTLPPLSVIKNKGEGVLKARLIIILFEPGIEQGKDIVDEFIEVFPGESANIVELFNSVGYSVNKKGTHKIYATILTKNFQIDRYYEFIVR